MHMIAGLYIPLHHEQHPSYVYQVCHHEQQEHHVQGYHQLHTVKLRDIRHLQYVYDCYVILRIHW